LPYINTLQRREELHTEKLRLIWELNQKPDKKPRRGLPAQQKKREMERSIKIDALAFTHWTASLGDTKDQAARQLGVRTAVLYGWQRQWRTDRLRIEARGRPTRDSDRDTRQLMIALFYLAGPGIGLPSLRGFFPDASKGELEYMLARYRRVHLNRNKVLMHVLRWHKPGTVWAIDFHKPQLPVDGLYPYVFLVRDLSSGKNLLALPVPSRELHHVIAALSALFVQYGAPLVLKSDCEFDTYRIRNDADTESARQKLAALLDQHCIFHLLSPPYTPEYNASIEAGIGSFQTRAHHEAARHGHAGQWNCDDVEAARLQANELARPWGHNQPTPDIAFVERDPITAQDRSAFAISVQQLEAQERQQRQQQLLEGMPLGPKEIVSCRRVAISRALVAHGLLSFRRRRITLPIKSVIWSNIR